MKTYLIILNVCRVISMGSLGAGYILGGYWLILPVFLALGILWLIMNRRSPYWSASSLLLMEVALAIIGVTLNLSIYLMVIGCTAALAGWDLSNFRQAIADKPPLGAEAGLEKIHLQSLGTAVFTGLFLAFLSSSINLQFPFGVMILLVLLAMGGLVYGVQYLVRKR